MLQRHCKLKLIESRRSLPAVNYFRAEPSPESFQQGALQFCGGGFAFVRGGLVIIKLNKTPLICSASRSIWEAWRFVWWG